MVDLGQVERKQLIVCRWVRQSAWQDVCRRYMSFGTLSGIQYVFFQAYVPGWTSARNVLFGETKIMAKGRKVLTTGEVAEICNVASRTVGKWFDGGLLKGYRIPGSRDRRIPIPELVRFMKKYEIPGHETL